MRYRPTVPPCHTQQYILSLDLSLLGDVGVTYIAAILQLMFVMHFVALLVHVPMSLSVFLCPFSLAGVHCINVCGDGLGVGDQVQDMLGESGEVTLHPHSSHLLQKHHVRLRAERTWLETSWKISHAT